MIERRKVLGGTAAAAATGIAVAASSFPKPAIAQSAPRAQVALHLQLPQVARHDLRRREVFAKAVAEMTDNKFQIQVFASGEIVPGLQAADAVTNGTVECCHTASYYYVGQGPDLRLRHRAAVRAQQPDAGRLAVRGRRAWTC